MKKKSSSRTKFNSMFLRLFFFAALAAAASAQQVHFFLFLSFEEAPSLSASPPALVYRAFPTGQNAKRMRRRRKGFFFQCSLTKLSVPFSHHQQTDPVIRQQQQLILPGAVVAPELALEREGSTTRHAQAGSW